jgi:hypothetical protein
VTCLEIRELLPELSLGVLSPGERTEVERHLRWCAGCRKETEELRSAAATIALAIPPADAPASLADRVVRTVVRVSGEPAPPRRSRTAAASIVAALVAIASLGWGAAMAGRADRYEERAAELEADRNAAVADFEEAIAVAIGGRPLPGGPTFLGELRPVAGASGGGSVLQLLSSERFDFNFAIVGGLDPAGLPYRVLVVDGTGQVLKAGAITDLDADGGAEAFHEFRMRDLRGFTTVRVVDGAGAVVLQGEVDQS